MTLAGTHQPAATEAASASPPDPAVTPTIRRPRRRRIADIGALSWLLPVGLLVAWQTAALLGWADPVLLPAPATVAAALRETWQDGSLLDGVLTSGQRWLIGFVIGGGLGLLAGSAVGLSRLTERLLDTSVQMARTVPISGLSPLLIIWLGLGESPKIAMVAMGSFFPVYINTFAGVRNVDRKLIEVAQMFRWGRIRTVRRVIIPAALPQVLTGVRYALGVAWLVLVLAELLGAQSGIGHLLNLGRELSRVDIVIGALLVFSLTGKFVDIIVRLLESRLLRWRDVYQGR